MAAETTTQADGAGARFDEPLGMLLVGAGHVVESLIRPAFAAGHLKPRHVQVLNLLAQAESTTQQQLAEAMHVDPSVLVGLLNELEGEGIVRRVRDSRDRRRHLVELSAAGRRTYDKVLARIEEAAQPAFGDLSDAETEVLRRMLWRIREQHTTSAGPNPC